jgi:aminomethyltransferase
MKAIDHPLPFAERRVRSSLRTEPGLASRTVQRERYRVPGGGSAVVSLVPGDRLVVTDIEGGQPGEMIACLRDGTPALGALGTSGDGDPHGLQAVLSAGGDGAESVRAKLALRGIDLGQAKARRLFAPDGPAGASESFVASQTLIVAISAPGDPMTPDLQTPPTDLLVEIHRAHPTSLSLLPLPDPLAEPRLELRIERCTAMTYEVKAGEFIQIVDVGGRQCSDFLSFDQRKLDRGIERYPEMAMTRSFLSLNYPQPGLASKFFDQDAQPQVEVVRDTVGRHDTFGLACAPKYYDDVGYPRHVNCTENLNAALGSYSVAPRPGWPAINLFYNTHINDQNVYYLDEPWSRPGDYVLLRAMTDLVCASSACPDDISAANGWDPTDIHVRVYRRENKFSRAVAYRMTADAEPRLTRESGFHPRTAALTRNMVEYRGFWLPGHFHGHGAVDEYWACRERATIMDLSALRKFEIAGPDAEILMQTALTRDVRKLSVGQVGYSAMCYETGGMIDDGTLFRMGGESFRWVGGDEYDGVWLRQLAGRLALNVRVKSSTDQLHNVSVQGPRSRDILRAVVWTPPGQVSLEELAWFRFTIGRIGDQNGPTIAVSRTGYTGELGYEVWCHPKVAPQVWDAIWTAGEPFGVTPLGLAGLDTLRIEAGLIFAGYEFSDQIDPFEAGIGFTVPLDHKQDDFIGRTALLRRKQSPRHRFVGLELDSNEVANHGDSLHLGRAQIGVVTSGTRSPLLGKSIALGRIDVSCSAIDTIVEVGKIDGHQKRIPARIVPTPFYDPEKRKPRGLG